MILRSLKVLDGPNQWASFPVLEALVDSGPLEDCPSHSLPGFNDRLLAWLPTLAEHAGPSGMPDSFLARLQAGIPIVHVLERVTLELESLGGTPVAHGHVRQTATRGVCHVVVEFVERSFAVACLHAAHRLLEAAIDGTPFDAEAEVTRLKTVLLEAQLGPSTRSIVNAARARGIPTRRLGDGSLVRLGQGAKQRRIQAAETDATSAIAESIAQDKNLTRALLAEGGVPVAEGRPVADAADAWAAAVEIGGPVVVKPRDGNQGRGVSVNLSHPDEIDRAWQVAREESAEVIVERFVPGDDYRLLVVGGRLVAAARRRPPLVVGDGRETIRALVDRVNEDPRRCADHAGTLSLIPLDTIALEVLAAQGLGPESVPPAGRTVLLRTNANLSTGGTAEDVTKFVHPEVAARAVEAARIVGLDVAGIDIVTTDITRPLETGGAVIEVNACPGLRMHLEPAAGTPRDVGAALVETLFPPGDDGRIPVAAVTGTNGKTTVVRLLAHVTATGGATVGMTCTEGVFIGERQIDTGDCSGPQSARRVLANPSVTTAVLETARGGILREGCGFDFCDVAVVTNIGGGDHLGLDGIDTPERLAQVKGAIVAAVRPGRGTAVLNAGDPLVVEMQRWCRGQVVYFALDPAHPLVVEHLAHGGLAATVRDGWIVLCDGPRETRLAQLERVPLVHGGLVAFQVENVLAAAAAAWRLGVPLELVRVGLETFTNGTAGSPARCNVLQLDGGMVIVDYGHNVSALEQMCAAVAKLPQRRRTAVYSAAGDRRDADLLAQGRLLGGSFDRVVIYEDAYIRGRQPGDIARLIEQGVGEAVDRRATQVEFGGTWFESAARVLDALGEGDVVLLQADAVGPTIPWLRQHYGDRLRETSLHAAASPARR